MNTYTVTPHHSIGPIRLGMTRGEVRLVFGEPSAVQEAHEKWGIKFPDKDYFFDNAFQVSYSKSGLVDFIETAKHQSYRIEYLGFDVHRDSPEFVIKEIEKIDALNRDSPEYPCNQMFKGLDVSIYREHSEKDHIDAFGISTQEYGRE